MSDPILERIRLLEHAVLNLNQDVSRPYRARPETEPAGNGAIRVTGRMIGPPGFEPPRLWCFCEENVGVHDGPEHSAYCRVVRRYFSDYAPIAEIVD